MKRIPSVIGLVGLALTLPIYLSSGLVAPLWAIAVLLAFWLMLLVTGIRWFTTRPWVVLCLPVVAVAFWWVAITLGEQVLGWQA